MNTSRYYCEEPIIIGWIYKHVSWTKYRVESIWLDATWYEETWEVWENIKYTQLKAWSYPKWTIWNRRKENFLWITKVKWKISRIFEFTWKVDIEFVNR